MHEGNLLGLLPAFNTKWLSYTIELMLDEAHVRACNNLTKNSKCHLKLATMCAQEKTSFPVKASQNFTPTGLLLFTFPNCVNFHLCSSCESTALYYLPLNYMKSHNCLLLMETVSTGGWVPTLMIAGFSVEQFVVLESGTLFCPKMHWEKCGTHSYVFCICKPHIFVWNGKKWHLAHDSFE